MSTTSCSTVIVFEEFVDEPKKNSSYVLYIDIAFITVNVVDLVSFIHDSKQRLDKKSVAFHKHIR